MNQHLLPEGVGEGRRGTLLVFCVVIFGVCNPPEVAVDTFNTEIKLEYIRTPKFAFVLNQVSL